MGALESQRPSASDTRRKTSEGFYGVSKSLKGCRRDSEVSETFKRASRKFRNDSMGFTWSQGVARFFFKIYFRKL